MFKVYNENAGGKRNPMRGVQTERYLYLFNPWSDGSLKMATATNGTATWKQMQKLASSDKGIAARVKLMEFHEVEELYDVADDPDCLKNLAHSPQHAEALSEMRGRLETYMRSTGDHALEPFLKRKNASVLAAYVAKKHAEADGRRANKRKSGCKKKAAFFQQIPIP